MRIQSKVGEDPPKVPKTKTFFLLALAALTFLAGGRGLAAQEADDQADDQAEARLKPVYRLTVDSIIHKGTTEFVSDALNKAAEADAAAIVIEL